MSKKGSRCVDITKEQMQEYFDMHLTYKEIAEKYNCSPQVIMNIATKDYGMRSKARQYQMQTDNPMAKEEIRQKVSDKIADMWEKGAYADRVNGMLGLTGENNPNSIPEGSTSGYRAKAKFYHPEAVCLCCGKQLSWDDKSLEVHHVDGDHNNHSLSNLKPLCHSCHKRYHRKSQPIVSITKSFVFDACHYLPYHDRKCKFLHGHTYHMEITVKDRVLQETGMVMDFGELKTIVNEEIIEPFDHAFLNEYIEYPTCELMISWIWWKLSKRVKGLHRIKVWETDGSYCELDANTNWYYLRNFEADWTKKGEKVDNESC